MISHQNLSAKFHANHKSLPLAIKSQEQEVNSKFFAFGRGRKCSQSTITYKKVNNPKVVSKTI